MKGRTSISGFTGILLLFGPSLVTAATAANRNTIVAVNTVAATVPPAGQLPNGMAQVRTVDPSADPAGRRDGSPEAQKLALEIRKLETEIANNDRSLLTWRGLSNLLFGNGALIVGILAALIGIYRYIGEQKNARREKEEKRFADVVESLGGSSEQGQMGAAVLLPSFLRKGYERFYVQVFNLASGNLRLIRYRDTAKKEFRAFRQALVTVYREAYPKARAVVVSRPGANVASPDIEANLNSSGVSLEDAYLVSADLKQSWLREACLDRAIVRAANLQGVNLEVASLVEVDGEEADLTAANLKHAKLRGARLSHSVLNNSRLEDADFTEANLTSASMQGVTASGTNFTGAILDGADLSFANFSDEIGQGKVASIELAASLNGTKLYAVQGLTPRQLEICRVKGARVPVEEPTPAPTDVTRVEEDVFRPL